MHKGRAAVAVHAIDQSGEILSGATILLTNSKNQQEVAGQTDAQGNVRLSSLPSGEYKLTVSDSGFRDFHQNVALHPWMMHKVNATLDVGAVMGEIIVQPHNIFSRLYHKVL